MSKALRAALVLGCALLCVSCEPRDQGGGFSVALVALDGSTRVLGNLPSSVFAPRVSPDGTQIAFELEDPALGTGPASERIWVAPLEQPRKRRALAAVAEGRNWAPMWTRDGRRLVFLVSSASGNRLYWQAADGTSQAEPLVDGLSPEDSTSDGQHISFITLKGDRDYGISLLDLHTREVAVLVDRPGSEQHSSHVSPDGRWVIYASNESGRHEIWLEPLPPDGRRLRLTRDGGSHPVWSPDGATVYFERAAQLHRLSFKVGEDGQPVAGEPELLPISGFQQGYRRRQFDILPDGQHFLMLYPAGTLR